MTDFFSYISSWSVLKWIVVVLIAGFIGQFGKMAANAIAAKIRTPREEGETPSTKSTGSSSTQTASTMEVPDKKLVKAIAKAKKKEAKKKN